MTFPIRVDEAEVSDGKGGRRLVRRGDAVSLLPAQIAKGDAWHSMNHREFMVKFLEGEGPYRISWIGRWPCGRTMLYLDLPNREPGAHASDFRYAELIEQQTG